MEDKSVAEEYLKRFYDVRPKLFFKQLDDTDRGLFVILRMLDRALGEVVAGDLANALALSTPRVAAALNTLEAKGYAVRTPSRTDRRKTVVCITDSGRQALRDGENKVLDLVGYVLEKVGRSELDEFIRISGKINAALDDLPCNKGK